MSFSFSQNLLNDMSESQGSQSNSSQPLTQPMMGMGYAANHYTRPNMAMPRPPSFPMAPTQGAGTTHYSLPGQMRAKYSRVESNNNTTNPLILGETLRETLARVNSITSSSSRMLEEGLVFLEDNVKKEKTETLAGIRIITENVQSLKKVLLDNNEETNMTSKNLVKPCLNIAQSLKKMLNEVADDQEDTAKVLDNIEKSVQAQALLSQDVLEKLNQAADAVDSMKEIMCKKKAEISPSDQSKRLDGEPMNTRIKYGSTVTAPSVAERAVVRNFTCVNRQVKTIIDDFTVMEIDSDSDSDDEWEE